MLKQIRNNASPWMIRLLLFVIILPFVLFFGYNKATDRFQKGNSVAKVGSTLISQKVYRARLEDSMRQMREIFKEKLPPTMEESMKSNVLHELISREATQQYGQKMGFVVTSQEIAKTIKENKNIFPDGVVDSMRLNAYNELRKRYQERQGEDFEEVVQRQLYVEKVQALSLDLFSPWKAELDESFVISDKNKDHTKEDAKDLKKKTAKTPETQPETQPVAAQSPGPFDLFETWLTHYEEGRIKVEVF